MAAFDIRVPVMLKAVAGGGGRGMRPVVDDADLDAAAASAIREAEAAFGVGAVFVEELITNARHVEVQVFGDGQGNLVHLFERDCSVQRRRQKVVEIAPAFGISNRTRAALTQHALALASEVNYRSAGTFEFLLSREDGGGDAEQHHRIVFIEANPRIQVEHTVTEEATGVDLVRAQLMVASGRTLADLGLAQETITITSCSMQARVSLVKAGTIGQYMAPGGSGVRVDGCSYSGYTPPTSFDPLLAKVIVRVRHAPGSANDAYGAGSPFDVARRKLMQACNEFHIGGTVVTNLPELVALLAHPSFATGEWTTSMLDDPAIVADVQQRQQQHRAGGSGSVMSSASADATRAALLDRSFESSAGGGDGGFSRRGSSKEHIKASAATPAGHIWVTAPMQGQIVETTDGTSAAVGAHVSAGDAVLVLLSMKMEHVVRAPADGVVASIAAGSSNQVLEGAPLLLLRLDDASDGSGAGGGTSGGVDEADLISATGIRDDLKRVLERRHITTDAGRTELDPKFARKVDGRHGP